MRDCASLLLVLLVLAFAGAPATAETHNVSIIDFEYVPATLTVAVGDSVVWTNNGSVPHTVDSGVDCLDDGRFESGTLVPGDTFVFEFNSTGDYHYFCDFHCQMGMVGEVVVEEEPSAAQTASWGAIRTLYR